MKGIEVGQSGDLAAYCNEWHVDGPTSVSCVPLKYLSRTLERAQQAVKPQGAPIAEALSPGAGATWMSSRLQGLVLLRAPLPLMQAASEKAAAAVGDCTCGAKYDDCDECICKPGGVR